MDTNLEPYLDAARERILVALDMSTSEAACELAESLATKVGGFKVGLELVNGAGFSVLEELGQVTGFRRIFYDAKFHDIPNTVAGAIRAAAGRGIWMVNVHVSGGEAMLKAAVECAKNDTLDAAPLLIGVTLLTSLDADALQAVYGTAFDVTELTQRMALLAKNCGLDGVVCSAYEIAAIRAVCGDDFITVVPGIRLAGENVNDQKRVATPYEAICDGARYLVLGRAITGASDPAQAADTIAQEIARALRDSDQSRGR